MKKNIRQRKYAKSFREAVKNRLLLMVIHNQCPKILLGFQFSDICLFYGQVFTVNLTKKTPAELTIYDRTFINDWLGVVESPDYEPNIRLRNSNENG